MAAPTAQERTRADRLNDLIRKAAPRASTFHDKFRRWPLRDVPAEGGDAARFQPPDEHIKRLVSRFTNDPERKTKNKDVIEMDARTADQFRRQAPYEIKTTDNGGIAILLTTEDGDVIAGRGATIEDALTALEAKLS